MTDHFDYVTDLDRIKGLQSELAATKAALATERQRADELSRDVSAFIRHEQTLKDNGIASHSEAVVRVHSAEDRVAKLEAALREISKDAYLDDYTLTYCPTCPAVIARAALLQEAGRG